MGFYFKSLLSNIAKVQENSSISWIFILNDRLPKLNTKDRQILDGLDAQIIEISLLHQGDKDVFNGAASENRSVIDRVVESLAARDSFERTVFFIPAMFSREIYPVFPTHGTANLMLFYDLIPFLYPQHYFPDHEGLARKDYAQRFREFYKADIFACISQTTADDLAIYFGVDPSRIISVLGAAADRRGLKPEKPKVANQLQGGYVLMPSGDDFRKNNIVAAQAFDSLHSTKKLVVTSNFSEGTKKTLEQLCSSVIFTGSVSDEEYVWLMDNAEAVFFPALYEGLGMPVLEAIERGIKVVCSNIPVFAEISSTAFYYFEPSSVTSMASALNDAMTSDAGHAKDWQTKRRQYPTITKNFSWRRTAGLFMDAVERCEPVGPKQKLAVFCPSPSSYSAVGKYAFEVHAELSRLYDIDYFVEEGRTTFDPVRPNILEYAADYYSASKYEQLRDNYDKALYHIGNSEFHMETILNSLRLSGSVIIHDTYLNGIFDYMQSCGFIPGERRQYEGLLDRVFECKRSSCLTSVVTNQHHVFCHSAYAKSAIGEVKSQQIPVVHQVNHPTGVPMIDLRKNDALIVSFAGIISEAKGIHLVSDISKIKDIKVKVFGFGVLGDSPLLQGLADNVEIMKDLSDKEFQDAMRSSDILVNYRSDYHGETSRSTLEAMRFGAAVIVKDVGWFSELPDKTVVKLNNGSELLPAIQKLTHDNDMRQTIGRAAKQFLLQEYSFGKYAQLIKSGLGE